MCHKSVNLIRRRRHSFRFAALEFGLFIGLCVIGSTHSSQVPGRLYLVAAVPSVHSRGDFPASLYEALPNKTLKLVREVVARNEGVHLVRILQGTVFVVHPHLGSNRVAIIRASDPAAADDVIFSHSPHKVSSQDTAFSPDGVFLDDFAVVISATRAPRLDLLVPWITDSSVPSQMKGTMASVSSESSDSRVRFDTWDEFAALRFEGDTGGPTRGRAILGSRVSNNLTMSLFGHDIVIDSLPLSLHGPDKKNSLEIVAASEQYVLLAVPFTPDQLTSGKLGDSIEVSIHDRARDRWKTLRIEGNLSACKLFGTWLATRVQMLNPDGRRNPVRQNERGAGLTGRPNVQLEYDSLIRLDHSLLPGTLLLQDLSGDRKVRIETGQEDSEILWAGADSVLYRVNDTIYQAKIVVDHLQDSIVLVKDEDVPEIHWVFWSQ